MNAHYAQMNPTAFFFLIVFVSVYVHCRQKCLNRDESFILGFTSDGITGARWNKWKRGDTARAMCRQNNKSG